MKSLSVLVLSMVLVGGMIGCKGTVGELRADGGAVVDNGASLVKKIMDAGVAVYDIVKKVLEDGRDNVVAVKDIITGPAEPAK